MDKWLLIGFSILLLLALPAVFYPLSKSKKNYIILTPIIVISVALGYWQWGGMGQWLQFVQQEEKQKKIHAVLQSIKSPEQIVAKLKASLASHPDSARGWYLLGRLYASQGEWSLAKDAYEKAYQLTPADETIVVNYGQSLWQVNQQQFDESTRAVFRKLLQKNPDQPDALAMLAMDAFTSQNYPRAIEYWEHLLKLAPQESQEAQMIRKAIAKAQNEMRVEKND